MNIFELSIGPTKYFVGATDEQHAYEQGTDPERFPDIHFLPFIVTEVVVPGCTVTVTPDDVMSRDEMKQWLKDKRVEFKPQLGDDKLRELIQQHESKT